MDPYGGKRQQNNAQQPHQYYQQPGPQQPQRPPSNYPSQSFQQQFVPQQQQYSQPKFQQQVTEAVSNSKFVPPPSSFQGQQQAPYAYGAQPQAYQPSFHAHPVGGRPADQPTGQLDNANAGEFYFPEVSWKDAFGSGGLPGDQPLLEELGINLAHIGTKSVAVLNPMKTVDKHLMDDTDLAGPLLFCIFFPVFLLFSGKVHFDAIYGIALIGIFGAYLLLNVMSEAPVSVAQTTSVLGYCMLPMLMLAFGSMFVRLRNVLGYVVASVCVLWCTGVASKMFVSVLAMRNQFFLVAYPIFLFYAAFALMTIF